MNKKIFVIMGVFVWLTVLCTAGPVLAENVQLKLAHFMPTMHVQHRMAFEPFAQKVEEFSDGEVTVKIYPGGTLGNPKTMVDAIRTGITDIGFVLPGYIPGRFQKSSVFELPFIFNSAEHVTQVVYDIYDDYLQEDYKNFKVLWFLSAPLSQLHTVEEPVLKASDFKGMKIRGGNAVESKAIKLLGGNAVSMPITELTVAMQKGVVDAAFTPYAALKSHKFIDVSRHITEINFSGALMVVLMNKAKWQGLSAKGKEAIDQAATEEFGLKAARAFDQEDLENIEAGKEKGIQFYDLPAQEKGIIKQKLDVLYQDWVNKYSADFEAQELLNAVMQSAKENRE